MDHGGEAMPACTRSRVSPASRTIFSWLSMHIPQPFTVETASDHSSTRLLHTLVQMVSGGLGVTLLPRLAVEADIAPGINVALRLLAGAGAWRTLALAWRPNAPRVEAYRAPGAVLCRCCKPAEA